MHTSHAFTWSLGLKARARLRVLVGLAAIALVLAVYAVPTLQRTHAAGVGKVEAFNDTVVAAEQDAADQPERMQSLGEGAERNW